MNCTAGISITAAVRLLCLRVKIIPELRELIGRYDEEDSPYLSPFLHRNRYHKEKEVAEQSALKRVNR
ncbi:hypothetical protein CE91St1_51520 [Parabacteroides goldsteinii]|nr:hypothetical protein CE91St1_51520 [Parabacteroides goldsteinii]GKG80583.1 hypothetical protein CE91St2_37750 [Parabacteroides goldsteinii]